MEPISQDKDNNFSTWEALKIDYLNDEKINYLYRLTNFFSLSKQNFLLHYYRLIFKFLNQ